MVAPAGGVLRNFWLCHVRGEDAELEGMKFPDSLADLTASIRKGKSLGSDEVEFAVEALTGDAESVENKAAFLKALHDRGETPDEIAAFARAFQARASSPGEGLLELARESIDFVGTGGDQSGAFNFSSTAGFLLASSGVRVIKHGNRGATSATGSADFLEALGIPLEAGPALLERALRERCFCYLFARAFHPAYKAIVPVRQLLADQKMRTLFNLLGPLINPARPAYQVMGVYSSHLVEPVAGALEKMGVKRGLVVHGRSETGTVLDKFTTAGSSHVRGVGELRDIVTTWRPEDLGLPSSRPEELRGGGSSQNVRILGDLLEGRAGVGITSTVLLNAGAGYWVMKRAGSLREGVDLAREQLQSGQLRTWLEETQSFFRGSAVGEE